MKSLSLASLLVMIATVACNTATKQAERTFHFEYRTTISGFPDDAKEARIWLPLPASDEAQVVTDVRVETPVAHRLGAEGVYGNRLVYLELKAPFPAELPVTLAMNVKRKEVHSVSELGGSPRPERLVRGDRFAPLNEEARSRAEKATRGRAGVESQARGIYDRVLADVKYEKTGVGWGRGDLEYVCASGKGNCSDFHTLFIAMARSRSIPAVFEIGFPLPRDQSEGTIGGYHCWAWYRDEEGRWRPVDASEADKDPTREEYFFGTICQNRVSFSRGRDLTLDPPQRAGPVNFLIYPYVEIDGKPDVATVEKSFEFRNL